MVEWEWFMSVCGEGVANHRPDGTVLKYDQITKLELDMDFSKNLTSSAMILLLSLVTPCITIAKRSFEF